MTPKVSSEHKERKKQEILQAALRVFRQKGYEPTTMQDIVDEAGISRGGLYAYFSSTEEIFFQLVKQFDEFRVNAIEALSKEYNSAWKALNIFLDGLGNGLRDIAATPVPVIYEHLVISWRKSSEFQAMDYQDWVECFAAFLATGVNKGEYKPQMPLDTIAQILLTFIDGISLSVIQYGPEKIEIDGQIQGLRQMLKELLQVSGE